MPTTAEAPAKPATVPPERVAALRDIQHRLDQADTLQRNGHTDRAWALVDDQMERLTAFNALPHAEQLAAIAAAYPEPQDGQEE